MKIITGRVKKVRHVDGATKRCPWWCSRRWARYSTDQNPPQWVRDKRGDRHPFCTRCGLVREHVEH